MVKDWKKKAITYLSPAEAAKKKRIKQGTFAAAHAPGKIITGSTWDGQRRYTALAAIDPVLKPVADRVGLCTRCGAKDGQFPQIR